MSVRRCPSLDPTRPSDAIRLPVRHVRLTLSILVRHIRLTLSISVSHSHSPSHSGSRSLTVPVPVPVSIAFPFPFPSPPPLPLPLPLASPKLTRVPWRTAAVTLGCIIYSNLLVMSSEPMDTNASGSTFEQRFAQLQAQVVAMATAQGGANATQKGFPDAPIFNSGKAEELRTWIIQLRNKLATQPHCYPDDQVCLRYAVNRLSGAALYMIRGYVSENTGRIRLESLNALLDLLRQAFDDPDRTRTANREI